MKHYLGICAVLLTLAAICFAAVHACSTAVNGTINGTVDHVAEAFSKVLHIQPQVTVNQRVILAQTAPIAELAVVTKEELVSIGLDSHFEVLSVKIPFTGKTFTAEATYRLKAGFDLRQPFSVTLDPATHALHATMPHAKILSVEQIGDVKFSGDDAALNRVTDADRAEVLRDLNAAAHSAADNSGLKGEAEQQVTQRLGELLAANGQAMRVDWNDSSRSPQPQP